MDFQTLIDLFMHLDKHLAAIAASWGVWIYALLFATIFVETGLVVMPFLPGDALNYTVGRWAGPRVFGWEQTRWFNRAAFLKTNAFYEQHGPITIVVGRFLPFIRTFAPFVAGVAQMSYPRFAFYNVIGGVLWVCSLSGIGYLIGDQPWVKAHFSLVALALIVIPATPALWVLLRHLLQQRRQRRRKV